MTDGSVSKICVKTMQELMSRSRKTDRNSTLLFLFFQRIAIEDEEPTASTTRETPLILVEADIQEVVGAVSDIHVDGVNERRLQNVTQRYTVGRR